MRKIFVIGIGAGNPDYLTIQAVKALNAVDVFFIPDKGSEKAALRQLRTDICDRFIDKKTFRTVDVLIPDRAKSDSDYRATVDAWHADIAARYEDVFRTELAEGTCGGLLVWGDPSLYDSTLRLLDIVRSSGFVFDIEVIPGITSIQALAARHRVALNRIGEPFLVTTGRRLTNDFEGDAKDRVVLLDGNQAFTRITDETIEIFWGAYVGTEDEILVSGQLSAVKAEIEAVRERARQEKGWIMDTYLLRRPDAGST